MSNIVYEATQSSVNQQEESEDDFVNVDTTKRRVSPRLRQVKLMEMIQMKRKKDEKGKCVEQVEVTKLQESPSKKAKKMMIAVLEENQENDGNCTNVGSSRQRKTFTKPKTPKKKKNNKVWFCEISGVIEPRKRYISGTPRIGKWNFTKLSEAWHNDFFRNITKDKIKDDFDDITAKEELLLEEVIIQQEDYKPKDYEQLFEENIEPKAEIVKLKRRIDELEIERRPSEAYNEVENNCGRNHESEGASKQPKKMKLKLKLNRSQTPKENVEVGDEE
ncbi:hypothetical protein FRX31_009234 [Thalictrum thalictroides]|uniref:Uncharacterized protein n=1 Tax=Thalictrum thalictroides TaxID=46969 RepID=A0A7J6WXE5_THATH|nr:hypothetical protein FRX31_009234 [Thalictrum thalictroides]